MANRTQKINERDDDDFGFMEKWRIYFTSRSETIKTHLFVQIVELKHGWFECISHKSYSEALSRTALPDFLVVRASLAPSRLGEARSDAGPAQTG